MDRMDRLGKMIYRNAWDYEVFAVLMRDVASTRISAELYTVSPTGEMSDIVTVQKQDIITKKNPLDFFLNLDGDFGRDDIDVIKNEVFNMLRGDKRCDMQTVQTKSPLSGIHFSLSGYIRENAEELTDNPETRIFIKDGYGYMHTECMDEFVKENSELGYKRIDILKRLKIMGVLKNGANRPYDIQVSIGGVKIRFYKIQLAEEKVTEEKADEVIRIDN